MIPKEVFHYTKKDTALEKILFDKKICFGQFGFTNDPREYKNWAFPMFDGKSLICTRKLEEEINKKAHKVITQEWKVFSVSQNRPNNEREIDKWENPFWGGYCRPRMWAYYAENHRGLCLKFNGEKLNVQLNEELGSKCKIFHGPVVYDDIGSIAPYPIDLLNIEKYGVSEGIREYFFEYWKEFFLQKSKEWETEYEYRWLIHNKSASSEFISIENIIEGVIVGVDFPQVYEPTLLELCKSLKIPAGKINWRNGIPEVNFTSIYEP